MKLDTLIAQVSDMNRATAFYRDVVGLTLVQESPFWTTFDVGGHTIALHPSYETLSGNKGGWSLGLEVEDLEALHQRLEAASATILNAFHKVPGGLLSHFVDPDGNEIQAIQRK